MSNVLEKFDASNETHVKWLKKFTEADTDKKVKLLAENPIDREGFQPMDMIHVLFGLCAKYTKAVFNKSAVILN